MVKLATPLDSVTAVELYEPPVRATVPVGVEAPVGPLTVTETLTALAMLSLEGAVTVTVGVTALTVTDLVVLCEAYFISPL